MGREKEANDKAAKLVRLALEKLRRNTPLHPKQSDVTKHTTPRGGDSRRQAAPPLSLAGASASVLPCSPRSGTRHLRQLKIFPALLLTSQGKKPK